MLLTVAKVRHQAMVPSAATPCCDLSGRTHSPRALSKGSKVAIRQGCVVGAVPSAPTAHKLRHYIIKCEWFVVLPGERPARRVHALLCLTHRLLEARPGRGRGRGCFAYTQQDTPKAPGTETVPDMQPAMLRFQLGRVAVLSGIWPRAA